MNTLNKTLFPKISTVDLFDEFEEFDDNGNKKYDRMILSVYHWYEKYPLIIERASGGEKIPGLNLTISNLKDQSLFGIFLDYHIAKQIEKYFEKHGTKFVDEIIFPEPFLLRAQNSSNRTGYGSRYFRGELVHQGTLYGETTNYAIVGMVINSDTMLKDEY